MTVHNKHTPKTTKSEIILPKKPYTKLLPKKIKSTKNTNRIDKIKTNLYKKIKIILLLETQKIKKISTNQYKVHTL